MDLGFSTHATHTNCRLVFLNIDRRDGNTLYFKGPLNGGLYPPGPAFLYVVEDGIPSEGVKIMVGDGRSPPVDHEAIEKYVSFSSVKLCRSK